jgi:predicted acyltransferase (DUF342 family)
MPLALITVSSVAVLAAGYLKVSSGVSRRQSVAIDNKAAFYTAEAGLTEAYWGLVTGRTGNVGSMAAPAAFGDGLLWVEATEIAGGRTQLEATGMSGTGSARLAMVLNTDRQMNVWARGIFSTDDVTLGVGVTIDAWDSSEGSYENQHRATESWEEPVDPPLGRIGSNGNITLLGDPSRSTVVDADVVTGFGRSAEVGENVVVNGAISARDDNMALPSVEVPSIEQRSGVVRGDGASLVVPPGEYSFEFIEALSGADVIIQGPATIVLDGLWIGQYASLTFDTAGGPIDLFVRNNLKAAGTAQIVTTSARPSDVEIQIDGPAVVDVRAISDFYGTIFAPDTTVSLSGDFDVFGGVVAKSLVVAEGVDLHFDVQLEAELDGNMPVFESWRILDFADASGNAARASDPFDALGVVQDTLRSPSEAHEDQYLELRYEDDLGTTQTYRGWDSSFSWDCVRRVTYCNRSRDAVECTTDQEKLDYWKSWWSWWYSYRCWSY